MPKGPQGQKRPADVVGAAVMVARIATGEIQEDFGPDDGKDLRAAERGRLGGLKGGKSRSESLSVPERAQISKKAAQARWARTKEPVD
jgi:hypothetical protein